jgi:hypothetical protein
MSNYEYSIKFNLDNILQNETSNQNQVMVHNINMNNLNNYKIEQYKTGDSSENNTNSNNNNTKDNVIDTTSINNNNKIEDIAKNIAKDITKDIEEDISKGVEKGVEKEIKSTDDKLKDKVKKEVVKEVEKEVEKEIAKEVEKEIKTQKLDKITTFGLTINQWGWVSTFTNFLAISFQLRTLLKTQRAQSFSMPFVFTMTFLNLVYCLVGIIEKNVGLSLATFAISIYNMIVIYFYYYGRKE